MGRYINPFTDWGFKRLFGQEFSKDLLINFLNDLFEGEFQIKDVTFKDKEQLGDTNDLRGCIFDIYCVTDDDKHFIVEMQNRWVPFFVNRFIYLSLPFFDKSEEECETGFEKWIYVLKYMEVLERLPFTAQKKIFNHLAKLADVRCLSSEEQEKYDESIKAVDDYYSGLYGSYIEGEEKGMAKGIAKGRAEGRAEGELSKGLTIARNLLSMGMSWSQIMQATGLTEEELKPLRGSYSDQLGEKLLYCLTSEIAEEFPSVDYIPKIIKKRHYELISDPFWK